MSNPLRIVHLGLGAFHRAHQAAVLQRLRDGGDVSWTLASGNLRDDGGAVETALLAQGGVYTLETVAPSGIRNYQRIDAVAKVIPYSPDHIALIALAADPDTRIVSFTVTEAGYCLDPNGHLDSASADFVADVAAHRAGAPPRTIYGALAAIAARRRSTGAGPITLLSCDNLRHNGDRVREGLHKFLALTGDDALREWTEENTSCPNSMVDRITPQPTTALRLRVAAKCGREDGAPVMAESFLQWVIEDDFCNGRPDWEAAGVVMTADVTPYEEAKIRILNASHCIIAWAGALAGYDTIDAAVSDPVIHRIVHDYVSAHVVPCLLPSPVDLHAYRDSVLARFGNAALGDSIERVACDSYAKFQGFIAPTLRQCLHDGADLEGAAIVPALLLAFLLRWHRGALSFAYRDQAMDSVEVAAMCASADPVGVFCADQTLWGDMAGNREMELAVRAATLLISAPVAATCA